MSGETLPANGGDRNGDVKKEDSDLVPPPTVAPATVVPPVSATVVPEVPATVVPEVPAAVAPAVLSVAPATVAPAVLSVAPATVAPAVPSVAPNVAPAMASAPSPARETVASSQRLRLNPSKEHKSDSYDDLQLDFSSWIFSSLERYLPPMVLEKDRDDKIKFMTEILLKYSPHGERSRAQRHRDYKQKIISNYQPKHTKLFTLNQEDFFVPSFLKAISENTEESYRSIISEPSPGVFTFDIFQAKFCEMLLEEVQHFEKWVTEVKFRIMRPNTMNKYGAVLDDFGLETMLDKLMEGFIRPIAKVFFPEVGGSTLDSHHGFVVEYGNDKDVDLGFHVDDAEVTLNACLGTVFTAGQLFFRGTRCEKHVNSPSQEEEIYDYFHVPGRAVLHRGRHRHGARATESGHRVNLLMWCRSSVYREMKRYQTDFSSWCGECNRRKKEGKKSLIDAKRSELLL